MNLKERIEEMEISVELCIDKNKGLIVSSEISKEPIGKFKLSKKSVADILKLVELDEEKILGIIKAVQIPAKPDDDEIYLHLEWIEAVAKAIAQGDVYKEER